MGCWQRGYSDGPGIDHTEERCGKRICRQRPEAAQALNMIQCALVNINCEPSWSGESQSGLETCLAPLEGIFKGNREYQAPSQTRGTQLVKRL